MYCPVGGPGVKSFLERFGEKCHERTPVNTTPGNSALKSSVVTPTTKSIQERLLKQTDVSSTASLAQQQKKVQTSTDHCIQKIRCSIQYSNMYFITFYDQEREKELAAIRSRFDKGSVWPADKEDAAKTKHQETQRVTDTCMRNDKALY